MRDKQTSDLAIEYIEKLFSAEDETLKWVRFKMQELNKDGMSIASHEARFLQFLIQANQVKSVVEFGTFAGYSAIWMARALPEDGVLYTLESDPVHAKIAQEAFAKAGVAHKIKLLVGSAMDTIKSVDGPVDMVFIDADKANYPHYLTWAEEHVKKGGLIVGDNTFLFGSVYHETCPEQESHKRYQAMREFNQRLSDSNKYTSILIPTSEGMTVAVKK